MHGACAHVVSTEKEEGHDMFVVSHTHKVQEFAVFWFSFFKTAVSPFFRALVFCFHHGTQEEPRGGYSSQGCSQDEGRCFGKGLEEAHCCREGSFGEDSKGGDISGDSRESQLSGIQLLPGAQHHGW